MAALRVGQWNIDGGFCGRGEDGVCVFAVGSVAGAARRERAKLKVVEREKTISPSFALTILEKGEHGEDLRCSRAGQECYVRARPDRTRAMSKKMKRVARRRLMCAGGVVKDSL